MASYWRFPGMPSRDYAVSVRSFHPAQPVGAALGGPREGAEARYVPGAASVREDMVNLAGSAGLPLWLDVRHEKLVWAQPLERLETLAHGYETVRCGVRDPAAPLPDPIYWFFPNVVLATDRAVFQEGGVQHSLWLLRPGRIGEEYIKTEGHTLVRPDGVRCSQAYGVVYGRALFLLQELGEGPAQLPGCLQVGDVRWIEAQSGQKVLVPPTYGTVIINLGSEPLVVSSLQATLAWPVHRVYEERQGAAYLVVEREGSMVVEPNRRYPGLLPPISRREPSCEPDLGIVAGVPLYSAYVLWPWRFTWLLEGIPATAGVG